MAEALDNHKILEKSKPKKPPYKTRYDGRAKKRQWEDESESSESLSKRPVNFDPSERVKRKKCIMLLGYSGANYFGMQRNPGMKTIEEDLFKAMLEQKLITEQIFNQAQLIQFQRAARTDKGVSAARQCCSLKLPDSVDVAALNTNLSEDIRIFCIKRVTKGFNSKDQCNARTYTYTLPTVAFANHDEQVDIELYRATAEKLAYLNKVLKQFEGTKNYHNFTSRKEYLDPSSKRYIMSFECSTPFLSPNNIEFATVTVKGQSFMMHQIRKMIGLTLAIVRGHTTEDTLNQSFTEKRIDIPMAPGLGLVLDQVHYDRYNSKYGEDGVHTPLTWEKEEEEIQKFVKTHILSTIFKTEKNDKPMVSWLETLGLHSYDERKEENKKQEEFEDVN